MDNLTKSCNLRFMEFPVLFYYVIIATCRSAKPWDLKFFIRFLLFVELNFLSGNFIEYFPKIQSLFE